MTEELRAVVYGVFLGCLTIGLGGILIGSSPVPGVVLTSIAVIGFVVFGLIWRNHE